MGIDFSHTDAHWAYSGFNRFRTRVAKTIGIDLQKMKGFTGTSGGISWEPYTYHALYPFLDHSDCDGTLSPEECRLVAPALRMALEEIDDEYDKRQGLLLVEGMEEAGGAGETLKFQ